jgi:uncharacterized phiE125 gp8 family phage protein
MYSMQVVPFSDAIAVSLADAKLHLRVDHSTEDALITRLIHAATDTAQSYTGRQIRRATVTLQLPRLPSGRDLLYLPRPPLFGLTWCQYYDSSDTLQDWVDDVNVYAGELCCLEPEGTATWPSVYVHRAFPVSVSYEAGYSTTAAVPDLIKQAILLLVGHLYENRETVVSGPVNTLPLGFTDLLMPYVVGDHFRQFEPTSLSEARDNG